MALSSRADPTRHQGHTTSVNTSILSSLAMVTSFVALHMARNGGHRKNARGGNLSAGMAVGDGEGRRPSGREAQADKGAEPHPGHARRHHHGGPGLDIAGA